MVKAFKITGNTYPHRRELRARDCIFDHDLKAYVVSEEKCQSAITYIEAITDLEYEAFEAAESQVTPATGDRLRELRQAHTERRRARLLRRADAADKRADKQRSRISRGEREFLSLMEPVKQGHHSQRRHENLLARSRSALEGEMQERNKSAELRATAQYLQKAAVAGDAEKARQLRRDARSDIQIGDTVKDVVFGTGVVTKINKNTFTINYIERGFHQTVDKSHVTLITKGNGEVKIEPKFKKGDRVLAKRIMHERPGVVLRRTPKGYNVQCIGEAKPERYADYQLRLDPDYHEEVTMQG